MSAIAKIAKNRHIFSCQNCDYNTCNKYDFEKHMQTIKHKKLHLSIESGDFSIKNSEKSPLKIFTCEKCNKNYKDNSGLWRHSKICTLNKIESQNTEVQNTEIQELKDFMKAYL